MLDFATPSGAGVIAQSTQACIVNHYIYMGCCINDARRHILKIDSGSAARKHVCNRGYILEPQFATSLTMRRTTPIGY
jgi:hypothetical protein